MQTIARHKNLCWIILIQTYTEEHIFLLKYFWNLRIFIRISFKQKKKHKLELNRFSAKTFFSTLWLQFQTIVFHSNFCSGFGGCSSIALFGMPFSLGEIDAKLHWNYGCRVNMLVKILYFVYVFLVFVQMHCWEHIYLYVRFHMLASCFSWGIFICLQSIQKY